MAEATRRPFRALVRFLVLGPKPDPGKPPTLEGTILPWPVRLLVVAAAGLLGWCWKGSPLSDQLSGGLQYAGLIAISLAISYWWIVFLINFPLALAWLAWPIRPAEGTPWAGLAYRPLIFVNRQIGHIEVLSVWIMLALVGPATLAWQLVALTAVLLLGEKLINEIALGWLLRKQQPEPNLAQELYWTRRPLFYFATLLGMIVTALLAPRQWFKLVPGMIAITLADGVRYLRHVRWSRKFKKGASLADAGPSNATERQGSRRADILLGPGLVMFVLAVLVCANLWARHRYDAALERNLPSKGGPVDYCSVNDPPAPAPDLTMFIVSDSQFHELRGRRFVGQMEFADALVPVALRPVELDVLSAAPLSRFATVFQSLASRQDPGARLWWAHLGDLADLSCQGELDRGNRLLRERYDTHAFAGIAPGNHDKAFVGNFFWSSYWDSACPSGRLEKQLSDDRLRQTWQASVEEAHGQMVAVPGWAPMAAATRRGGALVTATPLGDIRDGQQRRGVIAVFLDTSDGRDFDLGVAGLFGTFSDQQGETASRVVQEVRDRAGPLYQDPLYLIFIHHPLGAMAPRSDDRLKRWIASLDGDGATDSEHVRVLGIVSGHTHEAQKHSHCIGRREIPEIVVASTIDPPQEAALLSAGPLGDGGFGWRVQTLPSVARPGKTCKSRAPTISAGDCQRVMAELRNDKDCEPLFRLADVTSLGRDCSDIEHPLEIEARLQLASRWTGPGDEQEILADQRRRVGALWACVCRDGLCSPGPAAFDLDDETYFGLVMQELGKSPARERELTCLAWAGAAVQRYKTAGMNFADALRCAFDDDNVPGAHDYIVRVEVTPCY